MLLYELSLIFVLKLEWHSGIECNKIFEQRFCREAFCAFSITNTDVKFRLYVIRNEAHCIGPDRCGRLSVFWIFRCIEIFIKLVREKAACGNEIGEEGSNNNITVPVTLKFSYNSAAALWLLLRNYRRGARWVSQLPSNDLICFSIQPYFYNFAYLPINDLNGNDLAR